MKVSKKKSQNDVCHSERSEESLFSSGQTIRLAQGDSFEKVSKEVCREVGSIYLWLDEQLNNSKVKGVCAACGKCCDFEKFGHKLFVTTPEIMYFIEKVSGLDVIASEAKQSQTLESERLPRRPDKWGLLAMTTGQCPYQVKEKCSVYPYRFAGCRIFCCKGNADFQSELTEEVIKKFKALCEKFQVTYRYVDLPMALTNFSTPCI
jgi:Fe-S-cluster containining protein